MSKPKPQLFFFIFCLLLGSFALSMLYSHSLLTFSANSRKSFDPSLSISEDSELKTLYEITDNWVSNGYWGYTSDTPETFDQFVDTYYYFEGQPVRVMTGYEVVAAGNVETILIEHDFVDVSTNIVRNISLSLNLRAYVNPSFQGTDWHNSTMMIYANLTGSSKGYPLANFTVNTTLGKTNQELLYPNLKTFSWELPLDEEIDRLWINITGAHYGVSAGSVQFMVGYEGYLGYCPDIDEYYVDDSSPETGQLLTFHAHVSNHSFNASIVLFVLYENTSIEMNFNLSQSDAFDPAIYDVELQLNATGNYFWKLRIIIWYYSEETSLELVRVYLPGQSFPRLSYINYWSPYSTFAIPSTLKQYLAEVDELVRICDFSDMEDRGTNLTWRAYSGAGTLDFTVENKRICVDVQGNGVEADLEEVVDLDVYDSILFQLKIKEESEFNETTKDKAFYVVLNPSAWMADYRLNLYEYKADLGEWVTFVIPFRLFSYIYSSNLAEIGFYSPNSALFLSCELREIYAGDYWEFLTLFNDTDAMNTSEAVLRDALYIHESLNDTDLTFNASEQSVSVWENETAFASGSHDFTNNGGNLTLNNTRHFVAWESFENDTIGADPASPFWTAINEPDDNEIDVQDNVDHNKTLHVHKGAAASLPSIVGTHGQTTSGTYECWLYMTDTTKLAKLNLLGDATAVLLKFETGQLRIWSGGSYVFIANINPNDWYHLRVDYECGGGGYLGLGADRLYVWLNGTQYGDYAFSWASSYLDTFYFYMASSNFDYYFDAIDYSFDPTFSFNRNRYCMNGTYKQEFSNSPIFLHDVYVNATNNSQTYSIHIRNQTGDWQIYDNSTVYLESGEWLVTLNNSDGIKTPIIHDVSFNCSLMFYNQSQNHSFYSEFLNLSQVEFFNGTIGLRVRTNVSTTFANVSIYDFSASTWNFSTEVTTSYQIIPFENLTSDFLNTSCHFLLNFISNGTEAYRFEVDFVNLTTNYSVYDKYCVVANQSVSFDSLTYRLDFMLTLNDSESFVTYSMGYDNSTVLEYNLTSSGNYNYTFSNVEDLNYLSWVLWKLNSSIGDENASAGLSDVEYWHNKTYRLQSVQNRQNGEILNIPSQEFSLLLTDYWENPIYREKLNYSEYVDILVPYFTLAIQNAADTEIIFTIEKVRVSLDFCIAPHETLYLQIIADDYRGFVATATGTHELFDRPISRTSQTSFKFSESFELEPSDPLSDLIQFLVTVFSNPLSWIILLMLVDIIPAFFFYRKMLAKGVEKIKNKKAVNTYAKPTKPEEKPQAYQKYGKPRKRRDV